MSNGYVLRYVEDGLFDRGSGWAVGLDEATVYPTFEEAQVAATCLDECEILDVADAERNAAKDRASKVSGREVELELKLKEALDENARLRSIIDAYQRSMVQSKPHE